MWILGLKGLRKLRIITQGHGIHHDRKVAKFKQGRIESKRKTQKTGSRNFLASQDVLPSLINFLVFLLACSTLSGLVRMSQKAGSKQNKICQTWEKGVVAWKKKESFSLSGSCAFLKIVIMITWLVGAQSRQYYSQFWILQLLIWPLVSEGCDLAGVGDPWPLT